MTVRMLNCDVMDGLRQLPDESVHCVVTSPPYWGLRQYIADGSPEKQFEIGLEATPQAFVQRMVEVFAEVRRVLRGDGTCWVNLGDSYASTPSGAMKSSGLEGGKATQAAFRLATAAKCVPAGLKPKDLVGMPWRVALALQADGWYLRCDIIWHKPNPMPESVTDRPTKSHEYVFLLTKSERYFYDAEAIKEPSIYSGLANQDASGFKDPRSFNGKHQNGYRSSGGKNEATGDRRKIGFNALWDEAEEANGGAPPTRNKRSVWTVATAPFSEAHFATFPPGLIEPMILAGTSEKGCCAKCGTPWEREFETELVPTKKATHTFVIDVRDAAADANDQGSNRQKDGHRPGWINKSTTTGWTARCECDAAVVPCTVMDPFSGAGTTAMVADRLQRNAIGIELNPEYAAMSERRINGDRGGLLDLMEAS